MEKDNSTTLTAELTVSVIFATIILTLPNVSHTRPEWSGTAKDGRDVVESV